MLPSTLIFLFAAASASIVSCSGVLISLYRANLRNKVVSESYHLNLVVRLLFSNLLLSILYMIFYAIKVHLSISSMFAIAFYFVQWITMVLSILQVLGLLVIYFFPLKKFCFLPHTRGQFCSLFDFAGVSIAARKGHGLLTLLRFHTGGSGSVMSSWKLRRFSCL